MLLGPRRPEPHSHASAPAPWVPRRCFMTFWSRNPSILAQLSLGGNSPYKYCSPHSLFLIHNEAIHEEGKH